MSNYSVALPNELYAELERIARINDMKVLDLIKAFMRLGLLASYLSDNPKSSLFIHDGDDQRELIIFSKGEKVNWPVDWTPSIGNYAMINSPGHPFDGQIGEIIGEIDDKLSVDFGEVGDTFEEYELVQPPESNEDGD